MSISADDFLVGVVCLRRSGIVAVSRSLRNFVQFDIIHEGSRSYIINASIFTNIIVMYTLKYQRKANGLVV